MQSKSVDEKIAAMDRDFLAETGGKGATAEQYHHYYMRARKIALQALRSATACKVQPESQVASSPSKRAVEWAEHFVNTGNNDPRIAGLAIAEAAREILRLAGSPLPEAAPTIPRNVLEALREARRQGWYEDNPDWKVIDDWLGEPK
jgi:hypothetical protein